MKRQIYKADPVHDAPLPPKREALPKANLEDLIMARNPSKYLTDTRREQMDERKAVVEKILAHLPNPKDVLRILDRIERGVDEPGEVEAWISKQRKKALVYMAIGDDAERAKLLSLPVGAILAESSGEDADALPADIAVDRLKQRAAELAKVVRGVAGNRLGEEEPATPEVADAGPGF
jgi:hypothetical protein